MSPKTASIGLCLSVCCLSAVLCGPSPADPRSCDAHNSSPYLLFGPTTSYSVARRQEGLAKPQGCSASQLWMVSRHGTRYPNPEDYEDLLKLDQLKKEVLANHKAHQRGSLCQTDLDNLEQFTLDLPKDRASQLTRGGRQEMFDLGRHAREAIPELLTDTTYAKDKFRFLHTPTDRTKESAEYFYKGLFGLDFDSRELPKFEENIDLIQSYSVCPVWKERGAKFKALRKKTMEGEEMKKVQRSVSKRLGFVEPLKIGQVLDVYDGCRLMAAINTGKPSPWCAAFNEDELKLLEYWVDVFFYHKSGPGSDMNKRLACPVVKDLMATFRLQGSSGETGADNPQPVGSFYFTHHLMIDILNVGLQTSQDSTAPTYDNYQDQKQRQYRTAKTMPYSGHILAVLYQCPSNKKKMIFYQNEHAVEYPECGDQGECDLDTISNKFNSYVNDPGCTERSWCWWNDSGSGRKRPKMSAVTKSLQDNNKGRPARTMSKDVMKQPAVAVVGGLAVSSLLLVALWYMVNSVM